MANKIYVLKDEATNLKNAVVTYGAINASIEGDTLYIGSADRTPKTNPNFDVTPANVTIPAYDATTITASHLGDGVLDFFAVQALLVALGVGDLDSLVHGHPHNILSAYTISLFRFGGNGGAVFPQN